ncbi:MAG TPA: hypothetical protein VIL05_08675 [Thermoclostridium sp.]
MKPRRFIVDTTLRDGEQSAGIVFSVEEKVRLAELMDQCGIYQLDSHGSIGYCGSLPTHVQNGSGCL